MVNTGGVWLDEKGADSCVDQEVGTPLVGWDEVSGGYVAAGRVLMLLFALPSQSMSRSHEVLAVCFEPLCSQSVLYAQESIEGTHVGGSALEVCLSSGQACRGAEIPQEEAFRA